MDRHRSQKPARNRGKPGPIAERAGTSGALTHGTGSATRPTKLSRIVALPKASRSGTSNFKEGRPNVASCVRVSPLRVSVQISRTRGVVPTRTRDQISATQLRPSDDCAARSAVHSDVVRGSCGTRLESALLLPRRPRLAATKAIDHDDHGWANVAICQVRLDASSSRPDASIRCTSKL